MPLDFIDSVGENIHLALWKIHEREDSLKELLALSVEDSRLLATINHPEKRLEFLAGRALVQQGMDRLGADFKGLFRNEYGKPELKDSSYQVSLSHTSDYVVASLAKNINVGIDIEMPQEKMRRIANRLYSREEMAICGDDLVLMSKIWSAKEVLFKLHMTGGIDFKQNLFISAFNQDKNLCTGLIDKAGHQQSYTLAFKKHEQYFICYNIN